MRVDEGDQPPRIETVARDARAQGGRDRMRRRLAVALALEHLAPPLQADLARHRLARHLAHAADFDGEGIERGERIAFVRRREQRREIAVAVVLAHQRRAMVGIVHATAMSAAPTRRRSASSTFQVRTAAPVGMASTLSDSVAETLAQRVLQHERIAAAADQEEIEFAGAREGRLEHRGGQIGEARHRPGPDAVGKAQQRAAMRQAAEAEAAIAIGLDRRRLRQVPAALHRQGFSSLAAGPVSASVPRPTPR